MKLGIVGCGTVGRAIARCYMTYHEILTYDKEPDRRTHTLSEVLAADVVFVCLPTPPDRNTRACCTKAIDHFFTNLLQNDERDKHFVLKSTVPIGTTKRLAKECRLTNLVYSPEFLTERCALIDAMTPAVNIVGDPYPDQGYPYEPDAAEFVSTLYSQRFPGVPVLRMTSDEAEAVKLFLNGFFAVKVTYFNEIYALAKKLNLDWPNIHDAMLADGRIAHSHTDVPGHDGKLGFGGKCLPKDLATLLQHFLGTPDYFKYTGTIGAADLANRMIFRKE